MANKINKVSNETREKIRKKSVLNLPNRIIGNPELVKQAFTGLVIDSNNSALGEIDRVVEEINNKFDYYDLGEIDSEIFDEVEQVGVFLYQKDGYAGLLINAVEDGGGRTQIMLERNYIKYRTKPEGGGSYSNWNELDLSKKYVKTDGTVAMEADLDANAYKVKNLADGTNAGDAVNKRQLDKEINDINSEIEDINSEIEDINSEIEDIQNFNAVTEAEIVIIKDKLVDDFVKVDGSKPMMGDLDMNAKYIKNLFDGVNPLDAVNKRQLDKKADVDSLDNYLKNIWTDVANQTTTFLNDELVINRDNNVYKTTLANLLTHANIPELFTIVTELPELGMPNKIYLVPENEEDVVNKYQEYIWLANENRFERIGTVEIDLENYFTKSEVNALLNSYVLKEAGMGLSEENFSGYYRQKLDEIDFFAQKNVQSDWNQTNDTKDDFIKNKPTIPTKVSELENDSSFISEAPNDGKPYVRKNESWSEIEIDFSNLENEIELTNGVIDKTQKLLATLTHNGSYDYTNNYKYIYIKEKGGYDWILDTETNEVKRIGEQPNVVANWEKKTLDGKDVYVSHISYNAGTGYKVIPSIKKLFDTHVLTSYSQGVGEFVIDNPGKYVAAINAGKYNISNPNYTINGAEGVLISDGVIYEELAHPNYHVIAFDELGNANFFKGINASEILSQGYIGATTGFQPVILNGQKMDGSYISVPGGALTNALRQVICRLTNGDYKVYSFNTGVTFEVARDIIYDNEPDIDFAYQLDGGGSTTTYVKDTPVFIAERSPFGRRVLDAIVWELKDLSKELTFEIEGNSIKYIGNNELQIIGVNYGILSKLDEIDQNISNLDLRVNDKIEEAPINNKIYARRNGMWVEVSIDSPEPAQEFIRVRNYGSSDTLVTYDQNGMSVIPELSQTQEGTIITYTNTLDDVYPFNQIEDWTDEFGNKFVKIPPIWIKIYTGDDGETTGYDLSNEPFGGAELHPIFKNVETGEPQPYYFGKYTAALEGDKLISKAGKNTQTGSTLIGTFRTYAENNGLGYHQVSLHGWTLIRYLMVAYFGTTNVLSMFPAPTTQFPIVSGVMDAHKTAFDLANNANVFFGIENLVYDSTTLVDGVLEHQGEVYEESDFRNWADNYINYTLVGQTPPENGLYITKMKYVNGIEFPIDVTGGSSSTYFTDGTDGGHGDTRIIITGVEHSLVSNHLRGLYFWRRTYGTTGMSSVTGSRLMYSKVGE